MTRVRTLRKNNSHDKLLSFVKMHFKKMLPSETHKENKKQRTIKCLIQSSVSSIAQLLA